MKLDLKKLIASLVVCQLAGIFGSIFTYSSVQNWYVTLQKPELSPPNWIFAPVWITLYFLMGISLYLLWTSKSKLRKNAMYVFGFQLTLNAIWSYLFFGLQNPFYAFVELVILWLAITATIIFAYKVSKSASYLLIPYIIWTSIAMYLNYMIWILN